MTGSEALPGDRAFVILDIQILVIQKNRKSSRNGLNLDIQRTVQINNFS